jgi:TPR repeat protein
VSDNDANRQKMNKPMYPDIDWSKEPDLSEVRNAHASLATNFDQARQKLERLADRGSVASMWYLGDAYAGGRYTANNLGEAKKWYERAESMDWIPASYRLGRIHFSSKDYASAYQAFSRGKDKNYPPAIYRLGMMYMEGLGTKRNLDECRRLLDIAIANGHLFAKRDLARLYMSGSFGVLNIPKGFGMVLSLIFEMIAITISGKFKNPGFEDRTLA